MLIGIDGNEANQKVRVGSGVYGFELLRQFKKYQISNIKYQIYFKKEPIEEFLKTSDYWNYKVFGPSKFWTQIILPLELWREKFTNQAPDVFFTPTHYAPRFCPVPSVITIFDISFIKFPDMFLKKDLYQLRNWTAYSVKQAEKIITISKFSKEEIISYYGVHSDKVVVVYPGYDIKKFKIKNLKLKIDIIKKKYKIDVPYLLFIGTIQPRKNLKRLLEAFHKLKVNNKSLKLVLCGMINEGRGGWGSREVFYKIRQLKLESEVIMAGFVSDVDLPKLLAGAVGLVLPSLYEGFGIPVLEALASGVPVVISKSSSLPEVAGSAGIYIDNPLDENSIYNSLKRLLALTRKELDELIKLGLTQAEKFSWQRSAKKVLDILIKVGQR